MSGTVCDVASMPDARDTLARQESRIQGQIAAANKQSRRIAATIGDVVTVLSRDPKYQNMALKDLHAEVLPAVARGHCAVAYAQNNALGVKTPVAVVLWAVVHDIKDAASYGTPLSNPQSAAVLRGGKSLRIELSSGNAEGIDGIISAIEASISAPSVGSNVGDYILTASDFKAP